ncbi:MAG TPA: hypothetical protein VIU11_08880 [Nakamurella sp.]
MKRIYVFGAGVALGVAATRRTRRAKEAAAAAMKAKLTPSAIAADLADAIAELGNAVGAFASDVRQGAINRRATYRPLVENATGAVVMVPPEALGPAPEPVEPRIPGAAPPSRPPSRPRTRAGLDEAEPVRAGRVRHTA